MKCKTCGAELSDGYLFCQECGTPVDNSQKNKKTGIIIAVCVAAVAVLIIAAVVIVGLLMNKNKPDADSDAPVFQQETSSENETTSSAEQTTFHIISDTELTTAPQNNETYYVSTNTPDDAGIVVRKESTYYSDKITVLAEGAPIYIVSDEDNGTEYIQIRFDFNGTETYGWVLRKYVVRKPVADNKQYTQVTEFEQRRTNIYVSNITESGISDFVGKPTDDDILKFAMSHSILNFNPSVSGIDYGNFTLNGKSYDVRISAGYADSLSVRFFGTDINIEDMNNDTVKSSMLYGNSSQVRSNGIAIVTGVNGNPSSDEYRIDFSIYLSSADDESGYYSYTPAQAKADKSLTYSSDGYVILQKYGSSYKIVEYKRTN